MKARDVEIANGLKECTAAHSPSSFRLCLRLGRGAGVLLFCWPAGRSSGRGYSTCAALLAPALAHATASENVRAGTCAAAVFLTVRAGAQAAAVLFSVRAGTDAAADLFVGEAVASASVAAS